MTKKLVLFTAGLLAAGSGFYLYWQTWGKGYGDGADSRIAFKDPGANDNRLLIENPRDTGGMEWDFFAQDARRDPEKPGTYLLSNVRARYFYEDQLIVITADQGQVRVQETMAKKKVKVVARGGQMSGHVTLRIGPAESFADVDRAEGLPRADITPAAIHAAEVRPGQLRGVLAESADAKAVPATMSFDWQSRILSSTDPIQLRGDGVSFGTGASATKLSRVFFDGKGMTLALNATERRIEFLRIDQGDKLTIKPGEGGLNLENLGGRGGAAGAAATGESKQAGEALASATVSPPIASEGQATTGPATTRVAGRQKFTIPPTTYQMQLHSNVKISGGSFSIGGDKLAAVFQIAPREGKAAAATAPTAATTAAADTAQGAIAGMAVGVASPPDAVAATGTAPPGAPGGLGGAGKIEEIVATWSGPMELRPATAQDPVLAHARDAVIDVTGTAERPATGTWNNATLRAGRVLYHVDAQVAILEPGVLKDVELSDPNLGLMVCRGLLAKVREGKLNFAGPGRIEMAQAALRRSATAPAGAAKAPLVTQFSESLALEFDTIPDPKDGKKTIYAARHAVFTGDVDVRDATFWMKAQKIDATLAHARDARSQQAFEHMLASGGVSIRSARPGFGVEDADAPDTLSAGTLELKTAVRPGEKLPVIDAMIADGNVVAVTHQSDKADKAAEARNRKLLTQLVKTPRLEILLEPKGGEKTAEAAMSSFNARQLLATRGVTVELEGYGPQKIVATAETLTADPRAGTARLDGARNGEVFTSLAHVQQGDNAIDGGSIVLNQKLQTIEVPGAGAFVFTQPATKQDQQPSPVKVAWDQRMKFDQKAMIGTFEGTKAGGVTAKLLGKPEQTSEMTCGLMRVTLEGGDASRGLETVGAGGKKVRLNEIFASGGVVAIGQALDAGGAVLTRQELRAPQLTYNESTRTLSIPEAGNLVVEDYRPDPKGKTANASPFGGGNARGMTGFHWEESLVYAGDSGTIDLRKNVRMKHFPTEPLRGGKPASATAPAKQSHVELACDHLTATVSNDGKSGGVSASPVALGTGGQVKVSRVKAQSAAAGDTRLEVDEQMIASQALEFDTWTNTAIASGGKDGLVTVVSTEYGFGQAEWVKWDLTKEANAMELRKFKARGGR